MDADLVKLARFPYLPEAHEYVKKEDVTIKELLESPVYGRVKNRGKLRLLEAIQNGEVLPPATNNPEIELLSYPLARMIISCINDRYLIVRYAEAESKLAGFFLGEYYRDNERNLIAIAREFGVESLQRDGELWLHFSEYIHLSCRVGEDKFRLVNQVVSKGRVMVDEHRLIRLLQEAVRYRVLAGLPSPITPSICKGLEEASMQVTDALKRRRSEYEASSATARPDCYPPCIARLLEMLRDGENLSHTARFALTTFMHHVGFEEDAILELYRSAPDFNEDTALYQIRHVCSKGDEGYTPPSCSTMQTYGNCIKQDRLCARVKHPLSYYRAAMKSRKKGNDGKKESKNGLDEKQDENMKSSGSVKPPAS